MAPNAWEIPYNEVIGVARLAYKNSAGTTKGNYLLANASVWTITAIMESGDFRAVMLEKRLGEYHQKKIKVLSFSGSDFSITADIKNMDFGADLGDWTGANFESFWNGSSSAQQYQFGLAKTYQHRPDMIIGHSLGGGIAAFVSVQTGIKAATINPAPLMGSGFTGRQGSSLVINYVAAGEALGYARDMYQKNAIGRTYAVSSQGGSALQKHYLNTLSGYVEPRKFNR